MNNSLLVMVLIFSLANWLSVHSINCPPNKPLVNCFIDPCMFASCHIHSDAKCIANYCGGCNAEWFVNGTRVDCSEPTNQSQMKCNPVYCFVEPCKHATCSRFPNATCVNNYCNGCGTDWYMNNKKVQCN